MKKSSKNHRARKPAKKQQKPRLPPMPKMVNGRFVPPEPLTPEQVQQIVGAMDLNRLSGYDQEYWKFLGYAFFDLAIPDKDQCGDILIQKTEDGCPGGNIIDWVHLKSGDHHLVLACLYADGDGAVELFANNDDAEAFFRVHPEIENIRLSYEEVCKECGEQLA